MLAVETCSLDSLIYSFTIRKKHFYRLHQHLWGHFFLLSEDKSEIDLLSVRGPLHSSRVGDWNEGWQNWYLHMYHTHNHAMSTIPTPLLILIIMRKLQRHLSPLTTIIINLSVHNHPSPLQAPDQCCPPRAASQRSPQLPTSLQPSILRIFSPTAVFIYNSFILTHLKKE